MCKSSQTQNKENPQTVVVLVVQKTLLLSERCSWLIFVFLLFNKNLPTEHSLLRPDDNTEPHNSGAGGQAMQPAHIQSKWAELRKIIHYYHHPSRCDLHY